MFTLVTAARIHAFAMLSSDGLSLPAGALFLLFRRREAA
jgi:hypothetical protein